MPSPRLSSSSPRNPSPPPPPKQPTPTKSPTTTPTQSATQPTVTNPGSGGSGTGGVGSAVLGLGGALLGATSPVQPGVGSILNSGAYAAGNLAADVSHLDTTGTLMGHGADAVNAQKRIGAATAEELQKTTDFTILNMKINSAMTKAKAANDTFMRAPGDMKQILNAVKDSF